jgi:tRNA(Ile)-lysidine synthase
VRRVGKSLGLAVDVIRLRPPKKRSEDEARRGRYEAFARLARRRRLHAILLAHHEDDQVETVIMRLLRDAGVSGLAGMGVERRLGSGLKTLVLRPLLGFTREEIRSVLRNTPQSFVEDSSNKSPRYLRNRIRSDALRAFASKDGSILRSFLLRVSALASRLRDRVDAACATLSAGLVERRIDGSLLLDDEGIRRAPAALLHPLFARLTVGLAEREGLPSPVLSPRHADAIAEFAAGRVDAVNLPRRMRLLRDQGQALLAARAPRPFKARRLTVGRTVTIDPLGICIAASRRSASGAKPDHRAGTATESLRLRAVSPPLVVRTARSSDKFTPLGAESPIRVQSFLKSQKVPRLLRRTWPVVADRCGIIWVVGLRIADRVRRVSESEPALLLRATCT